MTAHRTLIHQRVDAARRGANTTVICRMLSVWAVLGDHQFLTGSLLLPEPEHCRRAPTWACPSEIRIGTLFDAEVHGDLHRRLAAHLTGVDL